MSNSATLTEAWSNVLMVHCDKKAFTYSIKMSSNMQYVFFSLSKKYFLTPKAMGGGWNRRCGISAVGNLAPRSLAHICAKDLRADIPWSENISSFCNRGVSADSRRIEFWRLEAWRIFTHFNPTLWFSAHHAPEIYVPEFRGPRFRPPKIYVPKIPSSILSPPWNIPTGTYKSKPIFGT